MTKEDIKFCNIHKKLFKNYELEESPITLCKKISDNTFTQLILDTENLGETYFITYSSVNTTLNEFAKEELEKVYDRMIEDIKEAKKEHLRMMSKLEKINKKLL